MAGLDKILEQIRQESDASVSEKLAEANKTADDIRQKAKEAVKDECAQIEERGKRQAEEALSRAESAAALYKRKAILAEKQRIIAEVFDEALKQLISLPEAEYFDTIIKIALKNALPQEGKIIFSEADKKRIPADFEMRLNAQLHQKSQGTLSVSEETREMDGGFVLSYGGVEQNCSFSALIDAERELMADRVQSVLFG